MNIYDGLDIRKSMFEMKQKTLIGEIESAIQALERTKKDVLSSQKINPHLIGNLINSMSSLQDYTEQLAILKTLEDFKPKEQQP